MKMWINPNADNTNQSKICPNCGQENDRYALPIYPFNKSPKVLNWCTKCLSTVEDITTVDVELPQALPGLHQAHKTQGLSISGKLLLLIPADQNVGQPLFVVLPLLFFQSFDIESKVISCAIFLISISVTPNAAGESKIQALLSSCHKDMLLQSVLFFFKAKLI